MAECAAAEARRTSSHHHSKCAPKAHRQPPTGPEQRQGQPAASPPPYQPLMSVKIRQMPSYRRPRGTQPNPEVESVSAYPRIRIRSRPRSTRMPTAQDYKDSPGHATATSPLDSTSHSHVHAHSLAEGNGPALGVWSQRWTNKQLRELRKCA